jgi:transmembrane sensor
MKSRSKTALVAQSVENAAADWVARELRAKLSDSERQARDAWLAGDDAHTQAYNLASGAYDISASAASDPEIIAMRQAALQTATTERSRIGRGVVGAAMALAACVLFAIVLARGSDVSLPRIGGEDNAASSPGVTRTAMADHYATRIGERLTVNLDDGSVMTLNTASEVRIYYSPQARRIELVHGQALFSVAHNAEWPFYVVAGNQAVRAIGTEFDVRLKERGLEVVLVEGRVAVGDASRVQRGDLARAVEMEAGERLVAQSNLTEVSAIDTDAATAWRRGRVSFAETPLPQAIEEINRYRAEPLIIRDPRVASLTLSGTYRTADAGAFENALAGALPVSAERDADGATVIVWRSRHESGLQP